MKKRLFVLALRAAVWAIRKFAADDTISNGGSKAPSIVIDSTADVTPHYHNKVALVKIAGALEFLTDIVEGGK